MYKQKGLSENSLRGSFFVGKLNVYYYYYLLFKIKIVDVMGLESNTINWGSLSPASPRSSNSARVRCIDLLSISVT